MDTLTKEQIAKMIDHAILKPNADRTDVSEGCKTALEYRTASVCVKPNDVAFSAKLLQGSDVLVGTVTGFPHGNSVTAAKVLEADIAIKEGAAEIDVVLPVGIVKSGEYGYVQKEVEAMAEICRKNNALLKVIFENCYLTKEEIIRCCEICSAAQVDFVKTSTGFGTYGAKVEDILLMREHTAENIMIKASGGIKTLDDFMNNYKAGARRQGSSSTKEIMEEAVKRGL